MEKLHEQPVVREFALRLDADVAAVRRRCAAHGVNPGVDVHALSGREDDRGVLLVAITERRTRADIDRLADVLGAAVAAERRGGGGGMSPIEQTADAARGRADDLPEGRARAARVRLPGGGRAAPWTSASCCPSAFAAPQPPRLPEVSEPEIVRHYVGISKRNFDLDSGFYPLGSCTMKHNPRLHERVAALPGHARLHPLQDPERAQGALELMWNLQGALAELSGLAHVSLQPSAGSHGELAGVLLTRAYHEDRGESRHKVLTPDTAHGTNPATVTMAGFEVVKLATNADGGIDIEDLRARPTRTSRA